MSSSIIVLGWPVRPIPASLIPAGIPVCLANCYTQNRVIHRSFCEGQNSAIRRCRLDVRLRTSALHHGMSHECRYRCKSHVRAAPVIRTRMIVLTVLPLAPRRGRESQLACRRLIGPDHHLFAILPLDRDRLVADLEATLIHGKVAEQSFGLRFQQLLPELVGVEAPGPAR